jgi:Zn-dependent M28 family amino/carboxypeptidase
MDVLRRHRNLGAAPLSALLPALFLSLSLALSACHGHRAPETAPVLAQAPQEQRAPETPLLSTAAAYGHSPEEVARIITREAVDAHIFTLSADEMMGRDPFSPHIQLAEDYIAEQFRRAGLSEFPQFPDYRNRFTHEQRSRQDPDAPPVTYELTNIVGYVEGTDPVLKHEYILFGAHHDHIGVRGDTGDVIYNGADDNATGTTAVLALAEYFAATRTNKRTLVFATFTAEERGLIGSRHLAANLPMEDGPLVSMINFEMIGKPAPDGSWSLMILGPERSTLVDIFRAAQSPDAPITLVDPLEHQVRYYNGSDNRAFDAEGYITTTLASPQSTDDPYYHRPNDHYEFLDIDYMTQVIRAVVDMTRTLVSGEATPVKKAPWG